MAHTNKYVAILLVLVSVICVEIYNQTKPKHPDADLNIVELLHKYKYPVESHEVITKDGYILTMHRIPHGRTTTNNFTRNKIPVFFVHGFMQSARDFVVLGQDKSLALMLADRGYDIWLSNLRGTTWSRRHIFLNPDKDRAFWNYSINEIGKNDVSAFIDYILGTTQHDSLHYVGYSQGTAAFFALTSEREEYAKKVTLLTALAPAIFMKNSRSPIAQILVFFRPQLEKIIDVFNLGELFESNSFLVKYLQFICNENSIFVDFCLHHFFLMQGYNYEGANKSLLSLIVADTPNRVSAKQLLHVIKFMELGYIHSYDNLQQFNVSKIKTPVALYYAHNDWTVNFQNMERVVRCLSNVVKAYEVPMKKFNHGDFVHSTSAAELVYNTAIDEIQKYDNL